MAACLNAIRIPSVRTKALLCRDIRTRVEALSSESQKQSPAQHAAGKVFRTRVEAVLHSQGRVGTEEEYEPGDVRLS